MREQRYFQMAMTAMRLLLVLIIVLTVAADPSLSMFYGLDASTTVDEKYSLSSIEFYFDFTGFLSTLPVCVYSLGIIHYSPSILHQMRDKREAKSVFAFVLAFLAACYVIVGVVVAFVFTNAGKALPSAPVTVLWSSYGGPNAEWWQLIIRYVVVYFPPLDVIASFPLNAYAMVGNMASIAAGGDVHSANLDRMKLTTRKLYELLATVPAVGVAVVCGFSSSSSSSSSLLLLRITRGNSPKHTIPISSNPDSSLGTVSEVSGILVFIISCIFPPLYAFSSRRRCVKVWGEAHATTPLTMGGLFKAPARAARAMPLIFLALGTVLTILVTISVVGDIIGNDLLRAV